MSRSIAKVDTTGVAAKQSALRNPTEDEYPADWVLRSDPRVTVGKGNTLNGRYVQSVVWTVYFEHSDKSVSAMTTCCSLRDVRDMAMSGELDELIKTYDNAR